MKDNYHVPEILEAVEILLNSKIKKKNILGIQTKNEILPPETEKIISQAEKYIDNK